jgi:hypothetical protein
MNDDLIEKTEAMIKRHEEGYFDWLPIKQIMPELVAEIKRLRAMNPFQVDVPIAIRISGNLFAYGNAEESAELQRLLMQLATKDALNNDLMANCNQLRDRCWKAEGELARWQQLAIDLKAVSYFVNSKSREQVFDLQPKEIRDKYRDRAAKELDLQVTQEAGYVERLERLALSMCLEAGWGQEEFEAALAKIREGK